MSFVLRVIYERDILEIINSKYRAELFLHGLNVNAIESWNERANPSREIYDYLIHLAQALSDRKGVDGYGTPLLLSNIPKIDEVRKFINENFHSTN